MNSTWCMDEYSYSMSHYYLLIVLVHSCIDSVYKVLSSVDPPTYPSVSVPGTTTEGAPKDPRAHSLHQQDYTALIA